MDRMTGDAPEQHPFESDPAERHVFMRLFYSGWHPTRFGHWVNRMFGWLAGLGLPPSFQVAVEIPGRKSGRTRVNPLVMPTVKGKQYLVSMLGPDSEWVKNAEAAGGNVVIHHGRRRRAHLVLVPPDQRAPVIREYVRIASSGRRHFPLPPAAPLADFAAIAGRYPVYRVDPLEQEVGPSPHGLGDESPGPAAGAKHLS
jgi:hypothetical protein